jgi:hypothetical protein
MILIELHSPLGEFQKSDFNRYPFMIASRLFPNYQGIIEIILGRYSIFLAVFINNSRSILDHSLS